jgi:hypothetical protein
LGEIPVTQYEIELTGPLRWYGGDRSENVFECPDSQKPGIYIWAIPYNQSYLVYYVGETGRSFAERFGEHTKEYVSGLYRIYDPGEFAQGRKRLIWEGMWKPGTQHRTGEFLIRYEELAPQIHRFLGVFRIFLGPFEGEMRLRERIEAAIAQSLQRQEGKGDQFQDTEIRYAPRREGEVPIMIKLRCSASIFGLPEELIV